MITGCHLRQEMEDRIASQQAASSKLTESDWKRISDIVFAGNYPGYRPDVIESPNGDGNLDSEKRYAHIALKYLNTYNDREKGDELFHYFIRAFKQAMQVARALNVPNAFMPDVRYSAMRILDYPPGAITHPHTDFDLFTLMIYRDHPEYFRYTGVKPAESIRAINHQVHYGEMLELIGLGSASPHEVVASKARQRSIVFFAIPDHAAKLSNGSTMGEWLDERMSRSRMKRE